MTISIITATTTTTITLMGPHEPVANSSDNQRKIYNICQNKNYNTNGKREKEKRQFVMMLLLQIAVIISGRSTARAAMCQNVKVHKSKVRRKIVECAVNQIHLLRTSYQLLIN